MSIEERVSDLEQKVSRLLERLEPRRKEDWMNRVIGSFADRPEFDEVLRLGREFRKEQNKIPDFEEGEGDAKDR